MINIQWFDNDSEVLLTGLALEGAKRCLLAAITHSIVFDESVAVLDTVLYPSLSTREYAERWNWSQSRVVRFLNSDSVKNQHPPLMVPLLSPTPPLIPSLSPPTPKERYTTYTQRKGSKGEGDLVGFDAFWDAYPEKKNKRSAKAAWKVMDKTERGLALSFLPTYIAAVRKEGISFKYGSSYLRAKTWEDEGYSNTGAASKKAITYDAMLVAVHTNGKLTTSDFESVDYGGETLWRRKA